MKKVLARIASSLRSLSPGFTMIELLIVISILGILAVAVLSAINPVEQINRGRDTASRGDAEQLISAIDRFNAFQGYYPWATGQGDQTNLGVIWDAVTMTYPIDDDTTFACPTMVKIGAGDGNCTGTDELKSSYIERVTNVAANPLFIYNSGAQGASTYVCFRPRSKAFLTEARARCGSPLPADLAPITTTVCPAGFQTSQDVYVCLP